MSEEVWRVFLAQGTASSFILSISRVTLQYSPGQIPFKPGAMHRHPAHSLFPPCFPRTSHLVHLMPEAQPDVVDFAEANPMIWLGATGALGLANVALTIWAIRSIRHQVSKKGDANLVRRLRTATHVLLVLPFLAYAVFFLVDPFALRGILPLSVASLIWSFASDVLLICYVMLAYSWALLSSLTLSDRESLRTTFTLAFVLVLLVLPTDAFFRFVLQADEEDLLVRATLDRVFLAAQYCFVLVTYFSLMRSTSKISGFIGGRTQTSIGTLAVARRLKLFRKALSALMAVYTLFIVAVMYLRLTNSVGGFFLVYFGVPCCYMFAGVLIVLLDGKLTVPGSGSSTPRTSASSKMSSGSGNKTTDFSVMASPASDDAGAGASETPEAPEAPEAPAESTDALVANAEE